MPDTTFPFPPTAAESAAGRALTRILNEERSAIAEAIGLAYRSMDVFPLSVGNSGAGVTASLAVPNADALSGHQRMSLGGLEARLAQRLANSDAAAALSPEVFSVLQVGVTSTAVRATFCFRGEWGDIPRGGFARATERALALVRCCGPDLPAEGEPTGEGAGGYVLEYRIKRGASTVMSKNVRLAGSNLAETLRRVLARPVAAAALQRGLRLLDVRLGPADSHRQADANALVDVATLLAGDAPLARLIRSIGAG